MAKAQGKFIVIEGVDGAGKDTQINLLKKDLSAGKALFVKDPGSTEVGLKLRDILLYDDSVVPQAELLMYMAARAQLMDELIRPSLEEGVHVISSRFDLSTIAYQIYGRERLGALDFVKQISSYTLGDIKPDLVILLDCPPEDAIERVTKSRSSLDRFEQEKPSFHQRVREGYHKHIQDNENGVIIDATQSIDDVYTELKKAVDDVFS